MTWISRCDVVSSQYASSRRKLTVGPFGARSSHHARHPGQLSLAHASWIKPIFLCGVLEPGACRGREFETRYEVLKRVGVLGRPVYKSESGLTSFKSSLCS